MAKQHNTTAVVLRRINYGEADKIISVITPHYGKLQLMAKGVRREKSKLAGGIELFSISNVTFLEPKNNIALLTSTRLVTHYSFITKSLERTNVAYKILKHIDKITNTNADGVDPYRLLVQSLTLLNEQQLPESVIEAWFFMNLLQNTGHAPDVYAQKEKKAHNQATNYNFDIPNMVFTPAAQGPYTKNHIKTARLLLSEKPIRLMAIKDIENYTSDIARLFEKVAAYYLH